MKNAKNLILKSTAMLLILLLLLSAVAACAGAGEGETAESTAPATEAEPTGSQTSPTESEGTEETPEESGPTESEPAQSGEESSEETSEESETPIYSDTESGEEPEEPLEPVDLGGYVYKAYVRARGTNSPWCEDFWVETDANDPLSHAVYQRNTDIEAKYNCHIKQVDSMTSVQYDELKSYYLDGETFELAIVGAMGAASAMTLGLFQDVASLPNLQLTHSAYDQNLIRDLSLGGKVYFLSGDMNISSTDYTAVTVYNTALCKNYDFGSLLGKPEYNDLYKLVADGAWTLDAMLAMANAVDDDADGSGGTLDATAGDTVGYFQYSASALYYFYGLGARVTANGSDGYPAIAYHTKTGEEVFNTLFEKLNVTVKNTEMPRGASGMRTEYFATGKTLFTDVLLWDVRKIYHDQSSSYGILPIPKRAEAQERYFDVVYFPSMSVHFWTLPTNCSNVNYATILLQAMAEASTETTMKAYFERTLCTTEASSPTAHKLLQTVKESSAYDLDFLYDWGSFISGTLGWISYAEENAYASAVTEDGLETANEQMQRTLTAMKAPELPNVNEDGLVLEKKADGTYRVTGCINENIQQINIPSTFRGMQVTEIGYHAFGNTAKKATSVTIPDSVRVIGDRAFYGLEALTEITLPAGIVTIDESTFYNCKALTRITLPEGLKSIGASAFHGCISLSEITIPAGVAEIGKEAFSGCTALSSVTFDNTEGWALYEKSDSEQPITPTSEVFRETVSDPARAATALKSGQTQYYWKRVTEE